MAVDILRAKIWPADRRLTVEVLVQNIAAVAFWRAVGYKDYSLKLGIISKTKTVKNYMNEPIIAQKSPIVQKVEPGTYFWCACGRSKGQPFCDGSHKGTGFAPLKTEIAEAKTVAWCGCKHTKNAPFCDGSHARFP